MKWELTKQLVLWLRPIRTPPFMLCLSLVNARGQVGFCHGVHFLWDHSAFPYLFTLSQLLLIFDGERKKWWNYLLIFCPVRNSEWSQFCCWNRILNWSFQKIFGQTNSHTSPNHASIPFCLILFQSQWWWVWSPRKMMLAALPKTQKRIRQNPGF